MQCDREYKRLVLRALLSIEVILKQVVPQTHNHGPGHFPETCEACLTLTP